MTGDFEPESTIAFGDISKTSLQSKSSEGDPNAMPTAICAEELVNCAE